jgi:hypothetical protein
MLLSAGFAAAQSTTPNPPQTPAPATPKPSKPKVAKAQLYGLGDQMFLINAGLQIPLFFQSTSGSVAPTNLSLGGLGSLEVEFYLNNNLTIGGEFGGSFAFSPNSRSLFLVPVTAKISWIFHAYPFDFPVFFGAGIDFMRLNNELYVGPIARPGFGAYWNFNSSWAFGLRAVYWWVPEIYFGPSPPADRTRFGNFLELSLSAIYHF